MSNLGLGVMIGMLGGNQESVEVFSKAVNQKIVALTLDNDEFLRFTFENGYKMTLFDDGQSCCERRYMTTDDKLSDFVGSVLLGAEVREAPEVEDENGVHEVEFLVITTSLGAFTCETHNEHNGYYGGFRVVARETVE